MSVWALLDLQQQRKLARYCLGGAVAVWSVLLVLDEHTVPATLHLKYTPPDLAHRRVWLSLAVGSNECGLAELRLLWGLVMPGTGV